MDIRGLFGNWGLDKKISGIIDKIAEGHRISVEEGIFLYRTDLGVLAVLANSIRERLHGNYTFFNKNIHLEPTNICIYSCKFCSYSRKQGEDGVWEYGFDDMLDSVGKYKDSDITEIHIVGGVHPHKDIFYYSKLLSAIKNIIPGIHIKAFTAVELDYMIKKAGMSLSEGLEFLKNNGLDSIPGGGAEIFNEDIRKQICHEKSNSKLWLEVHENAHKSGIPSNATMLYGHIESFEDRINHLDKLRRLQDKTGGFNAFIPLKYKSNNNRLAHIGEVNHVEDLRNYAVSRIFLDNIPHIKAYWPMTGKDIAQLSLSFGVDDIDGTIDDTTKIYSMAGAKDTKPAMTTSEMVMMIKEVNRVPVERNSIYDIVHVFD